MRKEIKHLMIDRSLTVEKLAEELGCTRQYLYRIIKGKNDGSYKFWENFKLVLNIPNEEIEKYKELS